MQIISSYRPMPLQFSPSQLFFNQQKFLLQKLGFFSPSTIDLHIKYSFQLVEEQYFIQWAEIVGFNTNHVDHEQAIIYKLGLANPKYKDIKSMFVDLEDIKSRIKGSFWGSLRSFPFWQWALFLILIILLPRSLGSILLYLNVIGIGVILLFSGYKTARFFIDLIKKKNTSYQGLTINYAQQSDTQVLTDEMMEVLLTLKDLKIIKVAYTGNCLYLYQEIKEKEKSASSFFSSLFKGKQELSEAEKAELTQKTLAYIQQPVLLTLLTSA